MVDLQAILDECERCRGWIEDALEYSGGTHDYEHIVAGIMRGTMQLWPAKDGCLVTEIISYPKKKVLNVFLGGGSMKTLLGMYEPVEEWAKAQGCSTLTINGRPGWERIFKKRGWQAQHVCLGKEVT